MIAEYISAALLWLLFSSHFNSKLHINTISQQATGFFRFYWTHLLVIISRTSSAKDQSDISLLSSQFSHRNKKGCLSAASKVTHTSGFVICHLCG